MGGEVRGGGGVRRGRGRGGRGGGGEREGEAYLYSPVSLCFTGMFFFALIRLAEREDRLLYVSQLFLSSRVRVGPWEGVKDDEEAREGVATDDSTESKCFKD